MHYLSHKHEHAHVVLFYRDFKDYGDYGDYGSETPTSGYCHRGLGINALMTAKVLRKHHIRCDIVPVWDVDGIRKGLQLHPGASHAVIEAPWVPPSEMAGLLADFPTIHFIVRSHSQIGFLQVEASSVKNLRDLLVMQEVQLNLSVAANTHRLQEFLHKTYTQKCLYLPNLYDVERVHRKRDESHRHRMLRIGSFGALRLLKNHTTAAAAALMMADRHGSDLEFYMNTGRKENSQANSVEATIKNMFANLRWAKIVEVPWEEWPVFRQTVAHMDLCLQPSFTETFNIVTADAVAEGVPSVVGSAIEWVPPSWQANTDSADDIARVGSHLLWDTHGAEEGLKHLERYMKDGIREWLQYLDSNPTV
jgi:hypothetical protein